MFFSVKNKYVQKIKMEVDDADDFEVKLIKLKRSKLVLEQEKIRLDLRILEAITKVTTKSVNPTC